MQSCPESFEKDLVYLNQWFSNSQRATLTATDSALLYGCEGARLAIRASSIADCNWSARVRTWGSCNMLE